MTSPDVKAPEAHPTLTTFNASMMFTGPFSVYLGGLLGAAFCAACLFVVAFTSTVPTQYGQVVAAPVEAK